MQMKIKTNLGKAILLSSKTDYETKTIMRHKEDYHIIIKRSNRTLTFINIYAPNIGTPKYITQILTDLKGRDSNTIVVWDFNTTLISMDR